MLAWLLLHLFGYGAGKKKSLLNSFNNQMSAEPLSCAGGIITLTFGKKKYILVPCIFLFNKDLMCESSTHLLFWVLMLKIMV